MEKIKNVFQSLKTWHKMVIGATLLAVATGALLYFTLPDKYVVVYQNLNDTDKQEITAELSKLGVDYQLANDGSIQVQKKDAPWIRKEMNGMGLPFNSKSGEEILLESSLGSSEQDKKMKQLVGTKKQLEQDIVRNFATVESASVQITLPEKETIFDEEKAKGTAAITIGVKRGQMLTQDQVAGIQQMISAAVPGVKAEEVSVIDSKKGIVSKGADESHSASSSSYEKEVEMQQQIEGKLKQDIDATLMTMFKQNEFKVNTKVNVNYDEITRQSEKYGDKGVLRSRQDQQERSTAQEGAQNNQDAGITANGEVPNYGTNNNQNGKVVYDQNNENKIENYEIDKTVETIKKHPELTKTNVVVWVDNDTLVKRKIDMTTFKEAIGTAAGLQIDPNGQFTNGQVNVVTVQFDQPKVEKTKEPEPSGLNWWLIGGITGGLLALGGLVWYFLARRKRKKEEEELEEYESLAAEEVAATGTGETIMEIPEKEPEPTGPTEPTLDEQVQESAKEHVEGTAKVIKKWLNGQ
ncbi:flagellar M-ring protein FliF [Bacillus cereus]|nr:flagellar M-ring protein FliF [Bacillus cereus]PGU70460.1 flagellar M-ring protein FliF [Bacillus cereus]